MSLEMYADRLSPLFVMYNELNTHNLWWIFNIVLVGGEGPKIIIIICVSNVLFL